MKGREAKSGQGLTVCSGSRERSRYKTPPWLAARPHLYQCRTQFWSQLTKLYSIAAVRKGLIETVTACDG